LRQIDPERHAGVHRFRVERSRKKDEHPTGMKILNVDQMENGIIVSFEDEVCAFFDAAFLYAQVDKRVATDFGEPDSAPARPGS
jgi:hypothetical protein